MLDLFSDSIFKFSLRGADALLGLQLIFARTSDVPKQMVLVGVNSGTEHQHVEIERLGDFGLYPGVATRNLWGDGADCGSGIKLKVFRIRFIFIHFFLRVYHTRVQRDREPSHPFSSCCMYKSHE